MSEPAAYGSWGRTSTEARRRACVAEAGVMARLGGNLGGVLPHGNGRSYGDSCLNDRGLLLDSRSGAQILSFDPAAGIVEATAGTLLCEITRAVAPAGWFLPVTPGTQFVTLGGAIANDVHGKNHHRRGTFGRFVRGFTLERSDREAPFTCTPESEPTLFSATIGGLGLTGLIRDAVLQLMPVRSTRIAQTTTRFGGLADYFALAEAADETHEYAVAWIDSLSTGRSLGRGHLIAGDHATDGGLDGRARAPLARVPLTPPISPLKGLALQAFNAAYFRKSPVGTSHKSVAFDPFFYPLDRIEGWNRLYGPKGLHQHQSVFPLRDGERVVRALLDCSRAHGQGSFLTVLKRFGGLASPGLLSFAREGYTLTLDFPHRGAPTLALLGDLDRLVVEAGGAVNPYKDARMSPETFARSFPNWRALEALRDPAIVSDFWRRTALQIQ